MIQWGEWKRITGEPSYQSGYIIKMSSVIFILRYTQKSDCFSVWAEAIEGALRFISGANFLTRYAYTSKYSCLSVVSNFYKSIFLFLNLKYSGIEDIWMKF